MKQVLALLVLGGSLWIPVSAGELSEAENRRILAASPLPEPPPDPTNRVADSRRAAALGQKLFFDPRLSASGRLSCASCHDPRRGWSNGEPLAQGARTTRRHVPTLWNVAYNRWFFWDGRADSLWAQALEAIESPLDLASDRLRIAHLVARDRGLRADYEAVFGPLPPLGDPERFPRAGRPDPEDPESPLHLAWSSMTPDDRRAVEEVFVHVGKAIAAFERRIVGRGAPFDRFVAGLREGDPEKLTGLSPSARRGMRAFFGDAGCWRCHSGPNFTDGEFHRLGVPERASFTDIGRFRGIYALRRNPFNGIGAFSDDPSSSLTRFLPEGLHHGYGELKTPTLRNVAETAPYMHNGGLATLREVLEFYSEVAGAESDEVSGERLLRPLKLGDRDVDDLISFLQSLSGEPLDEALMEPPTGGRRSD